VDHKCDKQTDRQTDGQHYDSNSVRLTRRGETHHIKPTNTCTIILTVVSKFRDYSKSSLSECDQGNGTRWTVCTDVWGLCVTYGDYTGIKCYREQ